jgi:vacuolar-type H+-ATPase subunit D/Vma8
MTTTAIKKQVDDYLPLLSARQQALVLEMIKSFLDVDSDTKRLTRKQYNKELDEAVTRVENGNFVSHKDAVKELSNWQNHPYIG